MLTVLPLLLLNSCATTVHDAPFCSPIPGGYGAVCDNLFAKNPETLSEAEWEARILSWESKGWALECTESDAVGNLKKEIELLCSKTPCNEDTVSAIQVVVQVLGKMQKTAKKAKNLQLSTLQ